MKNRSLKSGKKSTPSCCTATLLSTTPLPSPSQFRYTKPPPVAPLFPSRHKTVFHSVLDTRVPFLSFHIVHIIRIVGQTYDAVTFKLIPSCSLLQLLTHSKWNLSLFRRHQARRASWLLSLSSHPYIMIPCDFFRRELSLFWTVCRFLLLLSSF